MYYFSDNYVYGRNVFVSGTGGISGHPASNAIDGNKFTYWESNNVNADFTIDLYQPKLINSLWIKTHNIMDFRLKHSADGNTWTTINIPPTHKGGGIFWLFNFTEELKRYWRISITSGIANIRIYEIFLMKLRLQQLNDIDLPSSVEIQMVDTVGGTVIMADGSTVSYTGKRAYANIQVRYEYTSKANRDMMYLLYTYPELRDTLCILPDENYPDGIYRVNWRSSSFPLTYSISYKGSGFSGLLDFMEV